MYIEYVAYKIIHTKLDFLFISLSFFMALPPYEPWEMGRKVEWRTLKLSLPTTILPALPLLLFVLTEACLSGLPYLPVFWGRHWLGLCFPVDGEALGGVRQEKQAGDCRLPRPSGKQVTSPPSVAVIYSHASGTHCHTSAWCITSWSVGLMRFWTPAGCDKSCSGHELTIVMLTLWFECLFQMLKHTSWKSINTSLFFYDFINHPWWATGMPY